MNVEVSRVKKKILLMLFVLAGVFLFVQLGKNSPIAMIRRKANEIANDKVVRKLLKDYETIQATAKDFMMFRESVKHKNPFLGEKEILKQYILYNALSKKAEEFGLSLTTDEIRNASDQAKSFSVFGDASGDEASEGANFKPEEGSEFSPQEWISAIDEFNRKYLLTQKLEEMLREAYTGLDFESYFEEYKDALFGLWEKKEGSLIPNGSEK